MFQARCWRAIELLDTVINGMGYGIGHLARNPDFQTALRANPKSIVEAAEEILDWPASRVRGRKRR